MQTVSKDSQQRNQRFQRFIHIGSNATAKHSSPAEREGQETVTPCPAGYMADTLSHAVRVGIIRTKQKGVFMYPTPVILPKNDPPTLSKPQKIFQFQKEPFKHLGSMLYLAQERWNQKWTI